MQAHTGQHVLSAVADGLGVATRSWRLTDADVVTVDFEGQDVTGRLATIEDLANEHVRSDRPITSSWVSPGCDGLGSAGLRSRLLPKAGVAHGPLRVVTIDGLDSSTCCGTHLSSTGRLSMLKFLGAERCSKEVVRVSFAAGEALRRRMERIVVHVRGVADVVKDRDLDKQLEKVRALAEGREADKKRVKALWSRVAA
eukprot:CAMPEP_0197559168 /NCGR_PEP_ID=MMETSP1320-20131121/20676_1 /TAXON_ID=91990 /ORGANISM="Bolidomonas sp., Strain RCC2347" /LENGTH=197 /DNA_ID=CAMNT_0043120567 /DNA_START=302 /DNA_END=891 /DNA_ORIENTATION=-